MSAPMLAEPLWLAALDLDVDLERVPACEGFTDPDHKVPCPTPAHYVVRMLHVRDGETCQTGLMCTRHMQEQLQILRQIEAMPDRMPVCMKHLLPIDTKAVPL